MSLELTVMTYNVQSGFGTDGVADWRRTADVIRSVNPDVAGLEEVAINREEAPGIDLPALFSEALAMNCEFSQTIPLNNGQGKYGNAILSKYPFEVVDRGFLPVPEGYEKRGYLILRILAETPFYMIVSHLPYQGEMEGDEDIRCRCAEFIMDIVRTRQFQPAVWTGDFNTFAGTSTMDSIHRHWDVCNDVNPRIPTARCTNAGWRQIDFICTYPKGAFTLRKLTFIENMLASDHRPVVAELTLR